MRPVDGATLIQEGMPVAVHAQPALVAMEKLFMLPAALTETLAGVTVNAQLPACVTVKVLPATVSVPERDDWLLLAAMEKVTAPDPVAERDEVIVSQLTFAVALHSHAVPALTFSAPEDAVAGTDSDRVESEGVHGAAAAKTFDAWLADDPPGPTADTRA